MFKQTLLVAAMVAAALPAHAVTVVQWNFNSVVGDATTSTGSTLPAIGSGTAALVGGTTATFATGNGSSDPEASDDSGWNSSTYAAQGTGDKSRGVQFMASTVGFDSVMVSWDQRHSNTSAKSVQFQYTTDGATFQDFGSVFSATSGDTWFLGRSVDLTGVAGVANNANFGFRVVATFEPMTSAYAASKSTSTYGTTGTQRFDMVTVAATAVPEPGSVALLLAGLAAVGFMARRRA